MRTWHLTGIHIHFTNSQLGKHCCNFTDKQPTNTTYSNALLCFWGYPIQKDLLSCHRQWIPPCTFTQSPGITDLTKKKGSSINLVITSWFLYHIYSTKLLQQNNFGRFLGKKILTGKTLVDWQQQIGQDKNGR